MTISDLSLYKPCPKGHIAGRTENGSCRECNRINSLNWHRRNKIKSRQYRKEWDKNNPEKAMLQRARRRAKELQLPYSLTVEDVSIPESCPVFNIPLSRTNKVTDNSPSLDRIDNTKGYVKDNVIVVSHKANRIKNRWTLDNLRKVVEYYEKNFS